MASVIFHQGHGPSSMRRKKFEPNFIIMDNALELHKHCSPLQEWGIGAPRSNGPLNRHAHRLHPSLFSLQVCNCREDHSRLQIFFLRQNSSIPSDLKRRLGSTKSPSRSPKDPPPRSGIPGHPGHSEIPPEAMTGTRNPF